MSPRPLLCSKLACWVAPCPAFLPHAEPEEPLVALCWAGCGILSQSPRSGSSVLCRDLVSDIPLVCPAFASLPASPCVEPASPGSFSQCVNWGGLDLQVLMWPPEVGGGEMPMKPSQASPDIPTVSAIKVAGAPRRVDLISNK